MKTAVSGTSRLFIVNSEWCNTINAPLATAYAVFNFRINRHSLDDPERPESKDNCINGPTHLMTYFSIIQNIAGLIVHTAL